MAKFTAEIKEEKMKTVVINSLRIKNFKGVKDFVFEPNGQSLNISGKNASGKTTIYDAFSYLLFGKDSNSKADFQIKPVSDAGEEIHKLETEVEVVLDIDGQHVTLMKLYKEKWTKKRGSASKQMEGHTTEHFIDGVPVAAFKYAKMISELISIDYFKLVTSPYAFAAMPWADRRNLLMEICGDVSDHDVIKADDELSPLSTILAGCSVDDHRAKVKSQQKKINKKLKEIPARIAENQEMVKNAQAPDQKEKDLLDKKLADLQDKLAKERNNETISSKRVELNEINAAILKEQFRVNDLNREGKKPILDAIDALEKEKRDKANQIESLKDDLSRDEKRNTIANEAIEKVRTQWHTENAKKPAGDTTCPTCGQELPPYQIENATKAFNKAKALLLDKINQEGKKLKASIEDRDKAIAEAKAAIDRLSECTKGIDSKIEAKSSELDGISKAIADTNELEQKKAKLEDEIKAIKSGSGIRERDIIAKIQGTKERLDAWGKSQAEYSTAEKVRIRIADLEKQETELAAEYETLEKELFLTETFIRRKVEALEGAINSRFKLARFKLFEEQINGGLKETCEILYNGVPFDRALNSAARVNVGIDIINTLSDHFNFQAPIFIDNAESVNTLEETKAQVIGLYVSDDEDLTVEKTEIKKAS